MPLGIPIPRRGTIPGTYGSAVPYTRTVLRGVQTEKGDAKMKKTFPLEDLDCANCAAKMERAVAAIDGVRNVSVSFIMQRMTVEADDDRFDEIMKEAAKKCRKIEPDCRIVL